MMRRSIELYAQWWSETKVNYIPLDYIEIYASKKYRAEHVATSGTEFQQTWHVCWDKEWTGTSCSAPGVVRSRGSETFHADLTAILMKFYAFFNAVGVPKLSPAYLTAIPLNEYPRAVKESNRHDKAVSFIHVREQDTECCVSCWQLTEQNTYQWIEKASDMAAEAQRCSRTLSEGIRGDQQVPGSDTIAAVTLCE